MRSEPHIARLLVRHGRTAALLTNVGSRLAHACTNWMQWTVVRVHVCACVCVCVCVFAVEKQTAQRTVSLARNTCSKVAVIPAGNERVMTSGVAYGCAPARDCDRPAARPHETIFPVRRGGVQTTPDVAI